MFNGTIVFLLTSSTRRRQSDMRNVVRGGSAAAAATAGAPVMPAPDLATLSSLIEAVPVAPDQT